MAAQKTGAPGYKYLRQVKNPRYINFSGLGIGSWACKSNQVPRYINHSLYFEAKTFLHGLLVVEDKLSMAQSLESRVPFLDNDLVDLLMAGMVVGTVLGSGKRSEENE